MVALPDSQTQQATVRLYEPDGAPARSAQQDIDIGGGEEPGSAVITVRGEDLVPGVYELDVIAPPLTATSATVHADLGLVALTPGQRTLEASSAMGALPCEMNTRAATVRGVLVSMSASRT